MHSPLPCKALAVQSPPGGRQPRKSVPASHKRVRRTVPTQPRDIGRLLNKAWLPLWADSRRYQSGMKSGSPVPILTRAPCGSETEPIKLAWLSPIATHTGISRQMPTISGAEVTAGWRGVGLVNRLFCRSNRPKLAALLQWVNGIFFPVRCSARRSPMEQKTGASGSRPISESAKSVTFPKPEAEPRKEA